MTFRLGNFLKLLALSFACGGIGMATMYGAMRDAFAEPTVYQLVYSETCAPSI